MADPRDLDLFKRPHRRYNPLAKEWVLVSPQRLNRPWNGLNEVSGTEQRPPYDPSCHLCPGNMRAGGEHNPNFTGVFVFDNDFPALLPDAVIDEAADFHPLLVTQAARGQCQVVCYSPRHDLSLANLDMETVIGVVDVWTNRYLELGHRFFVKHVQIFENRGAMMGASSLHPHGQVWATDYIPQHVSVEQESQLDYLSKRGRTLLSDYVALELSLKERIVCCNDNFVASVPYWAQWPYETIVICRRSAARLTDLSARERIGLADITKRLVTRYDNLFEVTFPYSMGVHQAPTDGRDHPEWHLHLHFYPPLLRSAAVRKHMVGFELLAESQRDISPEAAAGTLRSLSERRHNLP
jgi:UDPglucose--hexose-1-phosphate uridylyltransferase